MSFKHETIKTADTKSIAYNLSPLKNVTWVFSYFQNVENSSRYLELKVCTRDSFNTHSKYIDYIIWNVVNTIT